MSSADNAKQSDGHSEKNTPKGDYDVGYCKPPAAHQFKFGNKANPKGRKKGSRNRKLVIEQVLFEPITVREGGIVKKMSVLEAIIKKTATKALTGDNKAALTIIGIAQREGLLTPEQEEAVEENLTESEKAILADFKNRLGVPQSDLAAVSPTQPIGITAEEHSHADDSRTSATRLPKVTKPVD